MSVGPFLHTIPSISFSTPESAPSRLGARASQWVWNSDSEVLSSVLLFQKMLGFARPFAFLCKCWDDYGQFLLERLTALNLYMDLCICLSNIESSNP